ncbi:MAG: hypothetical protein ABR600_02710 [Actinomycetota bacterium]
MHAVAVSVKIDEGKEDLARKELESQVVPMVQQAPGVVAGYWMEPGGGFGYSLVLFNSEESANGAAEMARSAPTPEGVTIQNVQVMEVVASF